MIKKLISIFMVMIFSASALVFFFSPIAAADAGTVSVTNSKVVMNFPTSLTFSAQIKSTATISDVRLRYQVDQASIATVTAENFVQITPSSSLNASYQLDMRRFGGFPPGTNLHYWWAVKSGGHKFQESAAQSYSIADNRYTWKNLTQGLISISWYTGDTKFGQALMDTAQAALVQLARDTGATPKKTVNIFIYANSTDLQGSLIYPNEWTGGVSFFQYDVIAIGISTANLTWGQTAMTHELTHNVVGQLIFNPYSDLPVWLNEGLAMYAQGPLTAQFTDPLSRAIRNKALISVRTISSPFSANGDKANLSYAESFTLVDYLQKNYGAEKMQALLKVFTQGSNYDNAFKQVYGFDLDGLNTNWQTWVSQNYK
jgi:hypothetical protein